MKKLMAVFAALIFLLSSAHALETPEPLQTPAPAVQMAASHAFGDMWSKAIALGETAAYVLDRDGQLFQWEYTGEPTLLASDVPIVQDSLFGENNYLDLTYDQQAQVNETVNLLTVDGDKLYAVNKFAGRLGTLDRDGVHWYADVDQHFLDNAGWERVAYGSAVLEQQLYLLLDYYDEKPNADHWCRLLRIDLETGCTQLYDGAPAFRLCAYGDKLLLLCQDGGYFLAVFDPSAGKTETLTIVPPGEGALAYDEKSDTICLAADSGLYCSAAGEPFELTASTPAEYVGSSAVITAGRLAFTGGGVWVVDMPTSGNQQRLTVRLHSSDSSLKALFAQQYPDVMVDWRTDYEMTAADVANAIRTGDTTDVFSVQVDSSFGSLLDKGFAAPIIDERILDSVRRMYPSLSAPLMHQGSVVAYPWDVSVNTWTVNQTLWEKYFPGKKLPATWLEFFNMMLEFEQLNNPDGDLFLIYWDYASMLEQVLTAYIQRQCLLGQPVDFTDANLTETLNALEAVHQSVEAYDEAEIYWDSETVGERSIFHYGSGGASRSTILWNENALLPFTFAAEEAPVYAASMRVLIVNPNAANREMAEAFVAQLTRREYSVMLDYCLHTDATEPYDQKPYTVTTPMVEAWQKAVESVSIATDEPLLSEAFLSQAGSLVERNAAGQLPMDMLLAKLNETARLVELEAQ